MISIGKIDTSFRFYGVKHLPTGQAARGSIVAFVDSARNAVLARANVGSSGGWELIIPAVMLTSGCHEIRFFGGGLVEAMPDESNKYSGSWESFLLSIPHNDNEPIGGSIIEGDIAIGEIDGVNRVFSSTLPFMSGTIKVCVNGVGQLRGIHYVELSDTQVQLVDPPRTGDPNDVVSFDYQIKK